MEVTLFLLHEKLIKIKQKQQQQKTLIKITLEI